MPTTSPEKSTMEVAINVDGNEVKGLLMQGEVNSIEVQFDQHFRMLKPISSKTLLTISNGRYKKSFDTRLIGRRETKIGEVCSFRSSDCEIWDVIHKIQRRAPRVRMKTPTTVSLVSKGGTRVKAMMIDISAAGLGLFVLEEVEAVLCGVTEVMCKFELPETGRELHFSSHIRVRTLDGAQVRYGLEFDPVDDNYEAQAELIRDFVMECQLDEIRRRNW